MSPLIEMKNVTKLYGNVIGVNDFNLELPEGVFGLLGPNGSGKTTFINLIMGQLRPSVGTVRVMGKRPGANASILKEIGLCPATDVYNPTLTGKQWVTYQVSLYGYTPKVAAELAAAALEQVKMSHAWDRPMAGYSLGMRQRCKLAQAIAHSPRLLIFDEPFNGLDPIGRMEMTQFLNDWTSRGKSLIVASHLLHEVEAVDCSFLLLAGGRLLASGTKDEVRAMLQAVPNKVHIKSPQTRKLAGLLAGTQSVSNIAIASDSQSMTVETQSPAQLSEILFESIKSNGYHVSEVRPEDDSLQSLFSILMQIHRGERS